MSTICVIIPVYNVESHLPECLDSIVNQTYRDLEIILVNDGSTDGSAQICEDYATRDSRIKVMHKENGGSSEARNFGLKTATGAYISFVDSDDLLANQFYQILMARALGSGVDIVECGFTNFTDSSGINRNIKGNEHIELPVIYETEEALKLLLEGPLSVVVWNKIYRKEVVKDIRFPVGNYIDDEYWTYKIFGNSSRIMKIPEVLYYYRQQQNSLMGASYSIKRLDGLEAHEERIEYIQERFPALQNLSVRVFSFASMYHYQQISLNKEIDPDGLFRNKILNKVKKYNSRSIISRWHWKDRLRYKFFIWSPEMYLQINSILDARIQKRINKTAHD